MVDDPAYLAERLRQEGEKTVAFFSALDPADLDRSVYTEGARWTVRQILAHQVEAEISVAALIAHILQGGPGVPENFDLDRYNEKHVARLDSQTTDELLALFADRRRTTTAMVEGLTGEELKRRGRHPFLGITEVSEMVKLMYRHNQIHQREIRRTLSRDT